MKYRTFGRMNWQVSEIGFGAWAIGGDAWGPQKDEDSLQALNLALDLGVNFIDTAQGYGKGHSEELIGKILKERGEKIGGGKIKIATKIPPTPGNWPPFPEDKIQERFPETYLRDRLEFSLKKLQAETIAVLSEEILQRVPVRIYYKSPARHPVIHRAWDRSGSFDHVLVWKHRQLIFYPLA